METLLARQPDDYVYFYLQNWEFQAYTNLAQNSFTRNGALYIKPVGDSNCDNIRISKKFQSTPWYFD